MPKPTAPKFYVVWKGRAPGVYRTWAEAEAQVKGFAGAQFKAFPTLAEAEQALRGQYTAFVAERSATTTPREPRVITGPGPLRDGMAVDAACAGVPGPVEFRGVWLATGEEVFKRGPFRDGTNNIGEFLAITHALIALQKTNSAASIYSDSKIALSWIRAKQCRTNHAWSVANRPLRELVEQAETWLAITDYPNKILKWETDDWGENPADFGRK